jgi:hypothetical protein
VADDGFTAKLIVSDTGPLITLAVANSLDYLLYPGIPVYLPDAVLYEATVNSAALGAANIASWVQAHAEQVRPIATEAYANFQTLRDQNPTHRQRDLGEQAALEAIRYGIVLATSERAILITEDDRVARGAFLILAEDRERVIPITTRDFLVGLETAGRINSADEVYKLAEDAGRTPSRSTALDAQHEEARKMVETLLRRR